MLPGSTFIETAGTRCNFEGSVVEYARAIDPAAGASGREVLAGLAAELGIEVPKDATASIGALIREKLGDLARFYWNTGQERLFPSKVRLVPTGAVIETGSIMPPLTHGGNYKREIREVGTGRFRVRR